MTEKITDDEIRDKLHALHKAGMDAANGNAEASLEARREVQALQRSLTADDRDRFERINREVLKEGRRGRQS